MPALTRLPAFAAAIAAALLPHRRWRALPHWIPVERAAFASALLTFFLGAAIGIPGFLEHAAANVSFVNQAVVDEADAQPGGRIQPRHGAGICGAFDLHVPVADPDRPAHAVSDRQRGRPGGGRMVRRSDRRSPAHRRRCPARLRLRPAAARHASGGPATRSKGPKCPIARSAAPRPGLPGCDLVIVASRRKAGWDTGVTVFTADAAYRIGAPVERTIAGRLRTLYPLTEHKDFEAVRKSVHYDLPVRAAGDAGGARAGRTTGDPSA